LSAAAPRPGFGSLS